MRSDQNIVLICADSVRADSCSFINTDLDTTPTLDRFRDKSITFTNSVSPAPRTPSSIPEIMTGSGMPNDHVDPNDWEQRIGRIGDHMANSITISERLRNHGYSTIGFTSNPWTGTYTNFDKGFDEFRKPGKRGWLDLNVFEGTRLESISEPIDRIVNSYIWRPINGIGPFARWPQYINEIESTVDSVSEPYFLWVFLLDTHSPFIVPSRDRKESSFWDMGMAQLRANSFIKDNVVGETTSYRNKISSKTKGRLRALYHDAIRSVDRFVNSIWDALKDDDPLLIFHSDHGEAFNEHGTFGHQRQLFEENIHVPLLVYNSGSNGTIDEVVTLRDLSHMIDSYVSEGTPFLDDRWPVEEAVLRTEDNSKFGIRTSRWKYIRSEGEHRLYDIASDPEEETDVSESNASTVSLLDESLERYIQKLPKGSGYTSEGIDASTEDHLSDLGYI